MNFWQFHRADRLGGIDDGVKGSAFGERAEAVWLALPRQRTEWIGAAKRLELEVERLHLGEPSGFSFIEQLEVAVINVHPASAGMFEQHHALPGFGPTGIA